MSPSLSHHAIEEVFAILGTVFSTRRAREIMISAASLSI
jgi:hypothetical protein